MKNQVNRRDILRLGIGMAGVTALGRYGSAFAEEGRVLKINTLASASAINVPMQAAMRLELGKMKGFAPADVRRTAKIPQIVQEVIAGSSDLGDADVASTLAAAEAGANIRIIGLSYNNTDQVIVSNADRIKSLKELGERNSTIAVNSIGDFMYVMLLGVFEKHNVPIKNIRFVEMGSSGDRARALLAGRVDAVPMHIEQAAQIATRGNFPILVRPWQEYDDWFSAVIVASSSWLQKDENKQAAVALLKSTLVSFRKTNSDYAWYKERVAEYASSKDLRSAGDDFLRPVWETLTTGIKAFPPKMKPMTPDEFAKVLPVYKKAGALKGTVDLAKIIDRSYLEQAIKELG